MIFSDNNIIIRILIFPYNNIIHIHYNIIFYIYIIFHIIICIYNNILTIIIIIFIMIMIIVIFWFIIIYLNYRLCCLHMKLWANCIHLTYLNYVALGWEGWVFNVYLIIIMWYFIIMITKIIISRKFSYKHR